MSLNPAPDGYPIKLVRDNTPAIINASGEPGDLFYRIEEDNIEHGKWLKKKLGEEVTEYLVDGGTDELSQILAVVAGLAEVIHGVDLEELGDIMRNDKRGGFLLGQIMYGKHKEYDK